MNPTALRQRKWTFGGIPVSQDVHVHETYFYICTCFGAPVERDGGTSLIHHATGSRLPFESASMLEDDAWREKLAREHLAKIGGELRQAADAFDAALAPRLEAVAP